MFQFLIQTSFYYLISKKSMFQFLVNLMMIIFYLAIFQMIFQRFFQKKLKLIMISFFQFLLIISYNFFQINHRLIYLNNLKLFFSFFHICLLYLHVIYFFLFFNQFIITFLLIKLFYFLINFLFYYLNIQPFLLKQLITISLIIIIEIKHYELDMVHVIFLFLFCLFFHIKDVVFMNNQLNSIFYRLE